MKKLILASLVVSIVFFACQSDSGQSQSGDQTTEAAGTGIDPQTVKLVCEPVEEPNAEADAPRHEVFIQIGDKKVKVADILNCSTLEPEMYDSYQFPEGTLDGVLGWWAGGGDLIFVAREGENFVVKQGYADEAMEGNDFGYKTVLTFAADGKELSN
jgi:hypothetical protein